MSEDRVRALVHDLRTPLTVVEGFARLLQRRDRELSDEQREEYMGRVLEGVRELREIVDAAAPPRSGS